MKKIINKPDDVVAEMLKGLELANPEKLGVILEKQIV